jgi:hypothetical protein
MTCTVQLYLFVNAHKNGVNKNKVENYENEGKLKI